MADQFLPVIISLGVAAVFAIALLGSAVLFGQRTRQPSSAKTESYESGVPLLDRTNKRISVKFYLVALVFVVLDVVVAFLYPWAVQFNTLPVFLFIEMLLFIGILFLGWWYVIRKGAVDWAQE